MRHYVPSKTGRFEGEKRKFATEDDYGKGMFGREEYEEMAELLARLQGRFLLSLNDTPEGILGRDVPFKSGRFEGGKRKFATEGAQGWVRRRPCKDDLAAFQYEGSGV